MKTNTLTDDELNIIISAIPPVDGIPTSVFKWTRVDVGGFETYVGDKVFVVTIVEKLAESIEDSTKQGMAAETVVIKYLQEEGFIENLYAYIGLQRFKIIKPLE